MIEAASSEFQELLRLLADQHLKELHEARSENADQSSAPAFSEDPSSAPLLVCTGPSPQLCQSAQVPVLPLEPCVPNPDLPEDSAGEAEVKHPFPDEKGADDETLEDKGEPQTSRRRLSTKLSAFIFPSEVPSEAESTAVTEGDRDQENRQGLSRLGTFLVSDRYEVAIGSLILLNVLVMAIEFQYDGYRLGFIMGYPGINQDPKIAWRHASDVFLVTNYVFTLIFVVDIAVRVPVLGCRFWKVWANWLDFFVVASAVAELAAGDSELPVNAVFLRMLRLVKLARGLRVIRFSKILESFHLLLKCLRASVNVLFWSLCLLFVIQCIAGMIISQLVKVYLEDRSLDVEEQRAVFRYYGTFTKTMLTMFEVLFANWSPPCRILVDSMSEVFTLIFIFYRCFVGFAVLNVVNAVFIQQTMKIAQADQELIIAQKQKAAESYGNKLKAFFRQLDTSGDGQLSWEEFSVMLTNPRMKHWMGTLELESHDLVNLFHMIDDGDGQISVDEFLNGAGRLKGPAKSVDVANVLAMVRRLDHKLESFLPSTEKKDSIPNDKTDVSM